MDSLTSLNTPNTSAFEVLPFNPSIVNSQAVALTTLTAPENAADVSVDFNDLYKSLSVSAQEIINKLNEILGAKLPNGIESLKPEEVTPEATAERIVSSVTGLFEQYKKGRGDDDAETVLNDFLKAVKQGVGEGYDDAYSTLEGLGAFEFEGVEEGVSKTRQFIDQKLAQFEAAKRKELGLDSDEATTEKTAAVVRDQILGSAGSTVGRLNIAA